MIAEGSEAPAFTLPAFEDGAVREVALSDYVGEDLVVLAFYPCDFSPLCTETACDVDTLDLFTMQKDVQVLAVSPDSTYSHARFAETYDLTMPLLADTDGSVTEEYGLSFEADHGEVLSRRAIVVINHDGTVEHVWSTTDLEEAFDIEAVREAISDVGSNATAAGRYRVGHAHYVEGRRAFTSAKRAYDEADWIISQGDFERAKDEFEEAADLFDTAERFVDAAHVETDVAGAREKATLLWQAAEWLADSANSHANGASAQGEEYREDAERPLADIQSLDEPPDPAVLLDRIENGEDAEATPPEATDEGEGDLGVDIDEVVEEADDDPAEGEDTEENDDAEEPESFIDRADAAVEGGEDASATEATAASDADPDGSTDDPEAAVEELDLADPTEDEDTDEDDAEEIEELDLTDPTEGEDQPADPAPDDEFGGASGDLDAVGSGGGSLGGSGGSASLDPTDGVGEEGVGDDEDDEDDDEEQSGADPSGVPSWVED